MSMRCSRVLHKERAIHPPLLQPIRAVLRRSCTTTDLQRGQDLDLVLLGSSHQVPFGERQYTLVFEREDTLIFANQTRHRYLRKQGKGVTTMKLMFATQPSDVPLECFLQYELLHL